MSATKNHPDQPKTCCVCGKKILSTMSAMFYYDNTAAKRHWSKHSQCDMSHS